MQPTESTTKSRASERIEIFQYLADPKAPSSPAWEGWEDPGEAQGTVPERQTQDRAREAAEAGKREEFEKLLTEETRKSFEAGRQHGNQEGMQAEREAQAAALAGAAQLRTLQVTELIEGFREERDRFLRAVESEVVELALAVAARILRREAQMDPLLLTGAVRVALGQLSGSTEVKLRVPPAELDLWTDAIAIVPNLALKPTVVSGDGMRLGDCMIETGLGSVDLGIRSQLGEIERGFFDRAGGKRAGPAVEIGDPVGAGRRVQS